MAQYVYGKNVVKQVLETPGRARCVFLAAEDPEIVRLAAKAGVPVQRMDRKTLSKKVRSEHHNGVGAEIAPYRTYTIEELLARKKNDHKGLLIMLDELEDPHNLGAVLRTADAVGADGVIFKKDNEVGLTPAAVKVSAGAAETVPCAVVTNLRDTCRKLKKAGWWIVGTDMGGQDYRSLDYDMDTVLVIGNEGHGMSRLIRQECDFIVSIPMRGKIESLNASVSAGILMYEIYSRRFPL